VDDETHAQRDTENQQREVKQEAVRVEEKVG
jgi:hypothetical protein